MTGGHVKRAPRLRRQGPNGPVITRIATPDELPQIYERYAPHELRLKILQRDGFRCRYCRASITVDSANIDHVRSWKHGGMTVGGMTVEANLVSACTDCNRRKGNQHWIPPRVKSIASRQGATGGPSRKTAQTGAPHKVPPALRDAWA